MPSLRKKAFALLSLAISFWMGGWQRQAIADEPTPLSFSKIQNYSGNPGAEMRSLRFSDEMNIKVALYEPKTLPRLSPVGIVAGYTMDMSYLHFLATELQSKDYPVYIIQPPGNGTGAFRSMLPGNSDGFHNTIEGFASMYMDGIGKTLSAHYGEKSVLMGHSRAGYQIRFFQTGLRFRGYDPSGRAILKFDPDALKIAGDHYASLVSLFSPLKPNPRLIEMTRKFPEMVPRLRNLQAVMIEEKALHIERTAKLAGVASLLSPLNLIWGPFAPLAAVVNASVARTVGARIASDQIETAEAIGKKRMRDLLTGKREFDSLDRVAMSLMKRKFPQYFEEVNDPAADVEAARWMVGHGVDDGTLAHLFDHSNLEGPTPAQAAEMDRLTNRAGLSSWTTMGVDETGKPYSVIRQVAKGRKSSALPYLILEASGDGSWDAAEVEARFFGAERALVEGGHGGAVLNKASVRQIDCHLSSMLRSLLKP